MQLRTFKKHPKRKSYRFAVDGALPEMVGDKRRADVERVLNDIVDHLKDIEDQENKLEKEEKRLKEEYHLNKD